MGNFAVNAILTTAIPIVSAVDRIRPALVLLVICVAQLMMTVHVTIFNMAVPAMRPNRDSSDHRAIP
jgi:hypothetical protein